jgi:cyclopropane fatty-acyl-phospholipid synthase-like methyltransferase
MESPYHLNSESYVSEVAAIYEKYAKGITLDAEYAQFIYENQLRLLIRLARYKFVARMLDPEDRVLEIGSGSGVGLRFLAQHCFHATGIDISEREYDNAVRLGVSENLEFVHGNVLDWNTSSKFDVVCALDVLEHLNDFQIRALLLKVAGVLSDGGVFIAGSPSKWSLPYQSAISRASHVNCKDGPEFKEILSERFKRVQLFSMNDEVVHTGNTNMAWYYFGLCVYPR